MAAKRSKLLARLPEIEHAPAAVHRAGRVKDEPVGRIAEPIDGLAVRRRVCVRHRNAVIVPDEGDGVGHGFERAAARTRRREKRPG